mmetsp:Transcript_9075/g.19455  ORF Transcript_9075/g.19455 Transcript_9075/m.19455 type:complete len:202 (-) Transcript_9075:1205-1810(-)
MTQRLLQFEAREERVVSEPHQVGLKGIASGAATAAAMGIHLQQPSLVAVTTPSGKVARRRRGVGLQRKAHLVRANFSGVELAGGGSPNGLKQEHHIDQKIAEPNGVQALEGPMVGESRKTGTAREAANDEAPFLGGEDKEAHSRLRVVGLQRDGERYRGAQEIEEAALQRTMAHVHGHPANSGQGGPVQHFVAQVQLNQPC